METEINLKLKILELTFNKNLQYKNTLIILLFTYFIGVIISLLTKQLKVSNFIDMYLLAISTMFILGFGLILLNEFNSHLDRIIEELKKLI